MTGPPGPVFFNLEVEEMSRLGVFPIPGEFKSEDRWFRYFNRKQALVLVVSGIIDYRVLMGASAKGMLVPALISHDIFNPAGDGDRHDPPAGGCDVLSRRRDHD